MMKKPKWPTLTRGYQSKKNVCALQCLLNYRNNNSALAITGEYDQATYNAVYAYQKSHSLVTDGAAGTGTLSSLTSGLNVGGGKTYAARAAQYLLSKFETISIDGSYGPNSVATAKTFQNKMGIKVDGIVGPESWQYLFGYYFYPNLGCDTATVLDSTKIKALANKNMTFVGRYLPGSNYPITKSEKDLLLANNFSIISIWERGAPISVSYFSSSRGTSDAQQAIAGATNIGQPKGTPIYFAVDYDAPVSDINGSIANYVAAIIAEFKRQGNPYKVGLYGSGAVLERFRSNVSYGMLAAGWSWRGTAAYSHHCIMQYVTTKVYLADGTYFTIDENDASDNAGAWR